MKNTRLLNNSRIPFALVSAIAAMLATQAAHAATGTWNVDADGLWSNAANWTPSFADGSGFTANFNNDITADRTVSLDSARTISTLVFGDSNTATAGSWTVNNNGNAANTLSGIGTITVNALGTGETANISAVIAGSTPIIKGGAGTLVLSGANTLNKTDSNNASFAWRLDAGTVVIASDSAFGVSTGTGVNATTLVNMNGATLQASGSARTVANPTWLSTDATVSGSESITFSGTFAGRGGNRTLTNNITGGTLSLTNDVYTKHDAGGQTLTFAGTGNTLISGNINNAPASPTAGNIIKSGAGKLTLSGANKYTGTTTVTAGTLLINGNSSLATGAVAVNGGTLGGIGTVGGATTVGASGTLAPGESPGTLAFANTLSLAGLTVMEIDGAAGAGITGGHDFVNLTGAGAAGALTYGGTMTLDIGLLFGAGTYSFNLFDFASETSAFTGISLADQYSGSFANNGFDVWTASTNSGNESWTFTGATGVLSLTVVPEPNVAALLGGFGLLALLRRRR